MYLQKYEAEWELKENVMPELKQLHGDKKDLEIHIQQSPNSITGI